mgnify:CR=1 FL=1
MQGKVEIAGVNTAKLKVLKSSETMELLRRSKAGDRQAREELIEGNLRLVLSVIQRFAGRGESVDDLFQVGCVGLIKAIDNFDISQPVKFSTYGVPMIVGEIRRYLRDNSAIRVSRSMRDTACRVTWSRSARSSWVSPERWRSRLRLRPTMGFPSFQIGSMIAYRQIFVTQRSVARRMRQANLRKRACRWLQALFSP